MGCQSACPSFNGALSGYKAGGFQACPTVITGDFSSPNGWETLQARLQPILGVILNRKISAAPPCPGVWNACTNPDIPREFWHRFCPI